jgi:hypothetical protein
MLCRKTFRPYNKARFSRPWGGVCRLDGLKIGYDFTGLYQGDERGGDVVVDAEPGMILAFGQKDTKGQKGIGEYYIVERSGDLTQLGKQEAYDHLEREERGGRPDEAPPELTNPLAGFSDEEIRAEFLLRKLKVRG